MRRSQTIEEQLSPAAPLMQFGISGRGERRTGGGLHSTKPEMSLASRRNLLFVFSGRKLQRTAPGDSGTAVHPVPSGAERTKASFWPGGCEKPGSKRPLRGAARPAPPRRSAAPAWLRALGARPGRGAPPHALRAPARRRFPAAAPRRPPAMSRGSRVALAVSALLSAAVVAAVHVQQRRELQRLRSGVVRDLERQNQKKENIRLLEEQIALTKQLMEERDKALMERRSQQS